MSNIISLVIDGQDVELDVEQDTEISPELTKDMHEIPGKIAWYGRLLAAAEFKVECAEADLRYWVANTSEAIDVKFSAGGGKQLSELRLKHAVESQQGFKNAKGKVALANELAMRLKQALSALNVKADMLRSLGAREREELQISGGISTGKAYEEDEVPAKKPRPKKRFNNSSEE